MKKLNLCFCISAIFAFSSPLQGAGDQNKDQTPAKIESPAAKTVATERKEYDVLAIDKVDNTDSLAIPFDDSEFEDEQEVNLMQGKEEFKLPRPAGHI